MSKISILSFAQEKLEYIFNSNQKYIKWGADNKFPQTILELYNSVPEHESSINFIESNLSGDGLSTDEINIWQLKKIVLDYVLFGGFTIKIQKLRNGSYQYEYLDISKCRFNPDETQIGYAEDWSKYKVELKWYPKVENILSVKTDGIFYFKNIKSREIYPRPHYLSAFKSIDTASAIQLYHNNNAKNGFTPNTVINFNNGVPDDDTKSMIERQIKEKFTGPDSQKFILSFQDTVDNAVTISKLDNDNLDQKFETLQKFIQNQIIVAHQITSGQLIGIKPENQGFSKTEYEESLEVFKDVVISGYRNELNYAFTTLFNKEVKIIDNGNNIINQSTNA